MLSFMKVKYMVLISIFLNVDLCECKILVLDNLIKKEMLTWLVLLSSLASLTLEQPY